MKRLKIISDSPLTDSAVRLLKDGVAPHEVVFASKASTSVLSEADSDPEFETADVAFGQPDVASVLRSTRLRWIHLTSAGYTRYDTADFRMKMKARSILVTNSSTVFAGPCAEHLFAFMLAHARKLPLALKSRCPQGTEEWNNIRLGGVSLVNQKVVILGFGAIARRLLELLRPFQMQIAALRRRPKGNEEIPIVTLEQLPQVLSHADHVINVLPDSAESACFVNAERLSAMKRGAVFYNVGRGATVDQNALLSSLRSGQLEAAWLDVTDPEPLPDGHPLLAAPNCFITPHTAGGHCNESESLVRHFLNNLQSYLNNSPLIDRIM
jgi:phosphoglycerate dehydrogenase-like enzyme